MTWIRLITLTGVGNAIRPERSYSLEMYIFGVSVRHSILICEGLLSSVIIGRDVLRFHKTAISLTLRA